MGIFDWFWRSPPQPMTKEQLRSRLFSAMQSRHLAEIRSLCQTHKSVIVEQFPVWRQIPSEIRHDPNALQQYGQALVGVAQFFATEFRDKSLTELLQTGNNPLHEFQKGLQESRRLMDAGEFSSALQILEPLVGFIEKMRGSAVAKWLALTLEQLGEARFHDGHPKEAVAPFERALELCRDQKDTEGRLACLSNLYEIHRYLGNGVLAADYAMEQAALLAEQRREPESMAWAKRAQRTRKGEPLNRVVLEVNGQRMEIDDLQGLPLDSLQFQFERNRLGLRKAILLTEQGKKLAEQVQYEKALELFKEASRIDPFAPHPHYLMGLTLIYLKRYQEAVEAYDATEHLAPGWYHCRADRWLAEKLATGVFPSELGQELLLLEDGRRTAEQNLSIAGDRLRLFPITPLYFYYGRALESLGRKKEAEMSYREGLACAEEPDFGSRIGLVLALLLEGEERGNLLQKVSQMNGNLVASAMAQLLSHKRSSITNNG